MRKGRRVNYSTLVSDALSRSVLFRNARILFPDRIEPSGDLRIRGGRIEALAPALSPEAGEEIIDLAGQTLAPGFIDIHIHGAAGRDAMEANAEAFDAICGFHATGGTTSLALTTISAPLDEITAVLRAAEGYRNSDHPGADLLGIHVEGPYFSPEKPGAHLPELLVAPTPGHYGPILDFAPGEENTVIQMTLAPELPGALELIDALRQRGVRVSGGHSNAWDHEACEAYVRGMEGVTHTFNCMSSARRNGPFREAGLLEFALSEPGILCEVIADGKHVSPTLLRMLYNAKGPDGICLITDATSGAGLPDGEIFPLGELEAVVRNGVSLLLDGSALAGSTCTMIRGVQTLVNVVGIPLVEAVRMATLNPARALGLTDRGTLETGARADLVVLTDALEVAQTWVGGVKVHG